MAKKAGNEEHRVMADEKVINHVSSFFSDNAMKFVVILLVVLAVIVVWSVQNYLSESRNQESADYIQETLSNAPVAEGAEAEDEIDVAEFLKKTEGSKYRAWGLWQLGNKLFSEGGERNLQKAEKVAQQLLEEGIARDQKRYQVLANQLITKIEEQRSFEPPEIGSFGPELKKPEEKKAQEEAEPEKTEPAAEPATEPAAQPAPEPAAQPAPEPAETTEAETDKEATPAAPEKEAEPAETDQSSP